MLDHDVRRTRDHAAGAPFSDSVHTHLRQIESRSTSSPLRHAMAFGELSTPARPPSVCTFPNGGWKKHGRTVPSVSITLDTHGALHVFGWKSPSPSNAA